ncbi:MAG: hypothetical protein N839_0008695 [Desulfofustis sp. PB-SRB1]|jgi:hypothetical protein|nr:hypothetical protein [Desulfofustis sp. PB-SRB1]MBM1002479.1 hypothetical protein [Desulfofustis sp. PB-SRB1]
MGENFLYYRFIDNETDGEQECVFAISTGVYGQTLSAGRRTPDSFAQPVKLPAEKTVLAPETLIIRRFQLIEMIAYEFEQ